MTGFTELPAACLGMTINGKGFVIKEISDLICHSQSLGFITDKHKKTGEEVARIIILTILDTSQQHYHFSHVVHGPDSFRRGNTVHGNKLAINPLTTLDI